ncbi:MAG TPA: 50S ribosomal protein L10 [Candidatus Dormibacteraeota bacterium]|jgi:large subunit ribosomal protein L10
MARPEKEQQVALLTEKLRKAKVAVLTDYRGLTVSQMEELRGRLRGGEVEYRVVKNTLARRAAVESGHDDFQQVLVGPVGIAFGYDDLGVPIKLLNEFVRSSRLKLEIVGGLVEGRVLNPDQLKQLADLPPREVLISMLAGTILSPIAQLASAINTPLAQLASALEVHKNNLEAA